MQCPYCNTNNRTGASFCSGCGAALGATPARVPLQPGQRMKSGAYKVVRPLSKGGMGAIYLVEDLGAFGRQRVIKEMLDYVDPADYADPAAYQQAVQKAHIRFEEEARTLASLTHRGIPEIISYFSENGRNYIVMECVEGADLEKGLTHEDDQGRPVAGKPYPVEDVIRWGSQVCQVLEYLAEQKDPGTGQPRPVVHQDIKPANLILDRSGNVRLVDFGTAKARMVVQPGGKVGLQKSSVYGTVGYAPPEQYQANSEPRSDVYALAATMYHLLTDDDPRGHPFNFPELASLPQELWRALDGALQQDVGRRPTATQFRAQLQVLLAPKGAAPPFYSRAGDVARTLPDLVQLCDQKWEDGRHHLYQGDLEKWFQALNRHDLAAKAAAIRQQQAGNQDAGLDAFLRMLDPGFPPPRLQVNPNRLDLGSVPRGQSRALAVEVSNAGRGYLLVTMGSDAPWVKVNPAQAACLAGQRQAVQVTVDTASLATGQAHTAQVSFQAGTGGSLPAPVSLAVPAPVLQVRPDRLDFGAVYRGQRLRPREIEVANAGGSYLEATLHPTARWLRAEPAQMRVEPGRTATVLVHADTAGLALRQQHRAAVEVSTPDAGQAQVQASVATSVPREVARWFAETWSGRATALALLLVMLFLGLRAYQAVHYAAGMRAVAAAQWTAARAEFDKVTALLLPYRDVKDQVKESYYQSGLAYMAAGLWEQARAEFEALAAIDAGYGDVQDQFKESYYQPGLAYMAAGEWEQARAEFEALAAIDASYEDVQTQIRESYYQLGLAHMAAGEWEQARVELNALAAIDASYRDVQDRIKKSYYQPGLAYMAAGLWEQARAEFEALAAIDAGYRDVQDQLVECRYQLGVAAMTAGDEAVAVDLLMQVMAYNHGYKDTVDRLSELRPDLDMVFVPAGEFLMGSSAADSQAGSDEKPQHTIALDAFWIDRTEVSNTQYQQCVAAGACQPSKYADDSASNGAQQPVVGVSWDDADAYCRWAGKRLPTEAEWEKAARGTDGRLYPWGNDAPDCSRANYSGCLGQTAAVGSYPAGASPYDVLDMAGNVWEWVNDWYDAGYYASSPSNNPQGPNSGNYRVLRGGSWSYGWHYVRAATHYVNYPTSRNYDVGFRCMAGSPGG